MTQGKCDGCGKYFQFNDGVKVVDVHRLKAKCPSCGEQLDTTSRQMKRYARFQLNIKTGSCVEGAPREVYS